MIRTDAKVEKSISTPRPWTSEEPTMVLLGRFDPWVQPSLPDFPTLLGA